MSILKPTKWTLIGYAVIIAGMLIAWLFTEPERWNHPATVPQSQLGEVKISGHPFSYDIECLCPPAVLEGDTLSLNFVFKLTRNDARNPAIINGPAYLFLDAGSTELKNPGYQVPNPLALGSGEQMIVPVKASFISVNRDLSHVNMVLRLDVAQGGTALAVFNWPIASRRSFSKVFLPYFYAAIVVIAGTGFGVWLSMRLRKIRERAERELQDAHKKASDNPEVARYAWDVARVKLEAYFDRNLVQVNLVFWIACIVMAVGFLFVLIGVWMSYMQPSAIKPALVASISGVITQFIGATFMVIYRSTMAQATEFMTVLERINSVGMSIKILDSLKDGTTLKDETRAHPATLMVISQSQAAVSPTARPKRRKTSPAG